MRSASKESLFSPPVSFSTRSEATSMRYQVLAIPALDDFFAFLADSAIDFDSTFGCDSPANRSEPTGEYAENLMLNSVLSSRRPAAVSEVGDCQIRDLARAAFNRNVNRLDDRASLI